MAKLMGLLVLLIISLVGITVHAAETITEELPPGLRLQDVFVTPQFDKSKSYNSAKVKRGNGQVSSQPDVVQVTSEPSQLGAVWSKDEFRFNLANDSTASMWINFGNRGVDAGDGMALVLHNDSHKTGAIASDGQSLGVWGKDNNGSDYNVAKTAIQNSWALEFDTFSNKSSSLGGAFDLATNSQHIAANYPGEHTSYKSHGFALGRYYNLDHKKTIDNLSLSDGKWHHLSLNWQAPAYGANTGMMTYTIDDKDPDTGMPSDQAKKEYFVIDTAKFNSADKQVYWGFTGSTGKSYEDARVIFESVPNFMNIKTEMSVRDLQTNQSIQDGAKVTSGRKVNYLYKLNYASGRQPWTNIWMNLPLDPHFKLAIGTVKITGGLTQETITAKDVKDGHLRLRIKHPLSSDQNMMQISLVGQVENIEAEPYRMPVVNQIFNGDNYIAEMKTPDYQITPRRPVQLTLGPDASMQVALDVKRQADAEVSGQLKYTDNQDPVWISKQFDKLTAKLNDQILTKTQYKIEWLNPKTGQFKLTLPNRYLKVGRNQLNLIMVDRDGTETNEVQAQLTLAAGQLMLKTAAKTSSFKPAIIDGRAKQHIGRQNDWNVVVSDSRGKGSQWQLQAAATVPTATTGHKLAGDVVFSDGQQDQSLTQGNVIVTQRRTVSESEEHVVDQQWDAQRGIFMNLKANAIPGNYQTVITWTLNNTPKDD